MILESTHPLVKRRITDAGSGVGLSVMGDSVSEVLQESLSRRLPSLSSKKLG